MSTIGPNILSAHPLLTPSRPSELLQQLPPGQTLQASVERLLPGGEAELRIGTATLRVKSPLNLAPGQPLSLQVENSSEGPLLRARQAAQQLETLASAWRSALPRQKPLGEVFTQLQQTLAQPGAEQLPRPIREAIGQLIQRSPNLTTLSRPEGLRLALNQSGPQLEARLLQTAPGQPPPNTQQDLKAGLLRLARQVLQWQSQQTSAPQSASNGLPGNAKQPAGLELYNALVNAANSKLDGQAPLTPSSRPLLPPLLPPATADPSQGKGLLGGLQHLLERLLPAGLATTPNASPGVNTNTGNTAATPAQTLLRIAAEILNQLEAGLARIQHHQLSAMPGDEPVRTLISTELPVFYQQQFTNIGIRIEQETSQQQQKEHQHQWRAVINFDLPQIGKVQALIGVRGGLLSTEFKSEDPATTELFRHHIGLLKKRLQLAGLESVAFSFTTGNADNTMHQPASSGLVRTEA